MLIYIYIGFTDNRDTLWQEMCSSQRSSITDPYLRAAFAFLTCSSEKYDAVLVTSFNFVLKLDD